MPRALWLLLWLRFTGWFRRIGLNLRTVKGLLLAVLGGGMLFLWLGSLVVSAFLPTAQGPAVDPSAVRQYGPLILLAYCVLTSAFSAGERAVSFSPGEVNFLFPGPFSRRQLLLYKIAGTFFMSLLTTLFLTFVLLRYASSLLTAAVSVLLAMLFLQLFAMAAALVASYAGAQAYNRRRRVGLVLLLGVLIFGLFQASRGLGDLDFGTIAGELSESTVVYVVLSPLRWFVESFTAEQVWPGFVVNALLSLMVNLGLVAIVLGLDAQYLEAASAASEKTYERLQRLRRGGAAAAWSAGTGKVRFSLPDLPRLGGVGPVAWRQMVSATRGLKGLFVFLLILGLTMVWPMFFTGRNAAEAGDMPHIYAAMLLGLSVFTLPMMLTFDFRGDVDRMDVLKSLPLPAWRLSVGQLLTPALMIALVQLGILGVLQAVWGGMSMYLIAAAAFALPVNFLLVAIENLMFLLFPTRMVAATPADFQLMGRYMLLFMAKFCFLGLAAGMTTLAGAVVYVLTDSHVVAGAVCWPIVLAVGAALVPLIASAFKRFDVARDTPP